MHRRGIEADVGRYRCQKLIAGAVGVVAAVLAVTPVATAAPLAAHGLSPMGVTLPDAATAETQLLDLLNQARVDAGLQALVRIPSYDHYAREWSGFMSTGGCTERDGTKLCHRQNLAVIASLAAPKGWARAGENVGTVPDGGTVLSLHNAFMNSASHRANILHVQYNAVGVGVTFDANGALFVTFEFIATIGVPNSTGPVVGFPEPPAGSSEEDAFVFYLNFLRQQAGVQTVTRQAVLDRESAYWSNRMLSGICIGSSLCNRKDSRDVAKAAVGSGKTKWWGGAVGQTYATDTSAQISQLTQNSAMRALLLRPDVNLVGIGYSITADGKRLITLILLNARNAASSLPTSGNGCGWVTSTLRQRAKGPEVRAAQCALASKGGWTGPVDGSYNSTFAKAIKVFQKSMRLRVNGTLDPKTRKALGVS
ncbi:MAG: hypothetical protein F2934_02785 [Actinobacteria bacterium]|uniref:Unannotated protein n=1 Tax=freshwater metagenome TaxID=449393 RepID=A0A6J6T862_9ZZZZ|nr:hypothetical protein [Actinomycetota bacterium]MTB06041.1 hypothetical protein [Actinomycetota bacterium]